MTDEPRIPEKGGLAIGLGTASAIIYMLLPALLVVGIWTLISVYAIVKWVGSAPDHVNPVVIALGVAGLVTTFVALFAVVTGLVGRGMNPKKREKDGRR